MTSEPRVTVVGGGPTPFELSPHNCFACGTLNRHGLGLILHVERGRCWTDLSIERRFEGWLDIAHGGILCTVLDEVMAWALVGQDDWGLTARMSVTFRRPAEIDRPLHAEGRVTRSRRRLIETAGQIVERHTGEIVATADGLYLVADESRKRELRERYGVRAIGQSEPPGPVDGDGAQEHGA